VEKGEREKKASNLEPTSNINTKEKKSKPNPVAVATQKKAKTTESTLTGANSVKVLGGGGR